MSDERGPTDDRDRSSGESRETSESGHDQRDSLDAEDQANSPDRSKSGSFVSAALDRVPRPAKVFAHWKEDSLAGLTSAIANIPDGMGSGVLAGVNPVYGLYTIIIGTPLAGLLTSTRAMVFNTTSAMTLVAVAGLGSKSGDERAQAIFVIALIAGVFQMILGLLGLGMLTRFVSNAVMTGFLSGIGVLIILGQLWSLTGYSGEDGLSKLEQASDLVANLPDIDPWTTVIGLGSLVAMYLLRLTPFRSYNLLIALAAATAIAQLSWFDEIALVESLGEIPRSLPSFDIPDFLEVPSYLLSGIAVAVVGLLQAAGVAQGYPNPKSSEPDDSRDFFAQGTANVAVSFFNGMPGGGSLSGTALNEAAGARTRLSMIIQALVVVIIIFAFSSLLSIIPMASLAALLIYSGSLAIKPAAVTTVVNTTSASAVTLLVTFLGTLIVPLQQAVVIGIILAGVLYIYRASTEVRVVELREEDAGVVEDAPRKTLKSNAVTVLDTYGSLFYAGARSLSEQLPAVADSHRAVVVIRLRGHTSLGSTFLNVVGRYAEQLQSQDGLLLLSGVEPEVKSRMARTGHLDKIGEENVFVAGHAIGESSREAQAAGEQWLQRTSEAVAT